MPRFAANLLLALVAMIWGGSLIAQRYANDVMQPVMFTGIRFLVGGLSIAPFAAVSLWRRRRDGRPIRLCDGLGILVMGTAGFLGAWSQQTSLGLTSVTHTAFLASLYVPLVPLFDAAAARRLPPSNIWPAVAGTVAAVYLLSGAGQVDMATGDLWAIASAFFWAVQIALGGRLSRRTEAPLIVACGQALVCGGLGLSVSLSTETNPTAGMALAIGDILFSGCLSVGFASVLQMTAQRWTRAADAAILMSSEVVVTALGGSLCFGDRLSPTAWSGCGLMLLCVIAVQLMPRGEHECAAG